MNLSVEAENKKGVEQVRIKVSTDEAQGIVIVAENGWHFDQYDTCVDSERSSRVRDKSTGNQIRISSNAPLRMTREEWYELRDAIDAELEDL
jgi:nitrogen fixation protein